MLQTGNIRFCEFASKVTKNSIKHAIFITFEEDSKKCKILVYGHFDRGGILGYPPDQSALKSALKSLTEGYPICTCTRGADHPLYYAK